MRPRSVLTPCDGCDHYDWCKRFGCTVWADDSREKYERAQKASTNGNAEIDELERYWAGR